MDTDDTESPGIPSSSGSRKRKRESTSERRLKGRLRKRRKRAELPPLPRYAAGNSPSTSDDGNGAETAGIPTRKFFPYNPEALGRLQEQVVAAGRPNPHRYREFTSAIEEPAGGGSWSTFSGGDGPGSPLSDGEGGGVSSEDNGEEMEGNPQGINNIPDCSSDDPMQDPCGEGNVQMNPETDKANTDSTRIPRSEEGQPAAEDNEAAPPAENLDRAATGRIQHRNIEEEERSLRRQLDSRTEMERLAIDVAGVRGSSCATNSSMDKLFSVVFKHMETVRKLQRNRSQKKTFSNRLRRLAVKNIPRVTTDLLIEAKSPDGTLEYLRVEGLNAIPEKYRRQQKKGALRVIREESSVSLQSIKEHHEKVHLLKGESLESIRKQYGNCILSLDGVEEAKSGAKKFHVGSIKIGECIYPYKVYDFLMGHEAAKVSTDTMIGPMVQEINDDPDIQLSHIVADMPERHTLRGLTTINGRWSCEFCKGKGDTGGGISWPCPKYWKCPLRSHDEMEGIARLAHGPLEGDLEDRQGITTFSPLFDLVGPFSIVWGLPVDQFHLIFEGIVKEMFKRMFTNCGNKESRTFHRALSELYEGTRVFSETPRATRPLLLSTLKGHEYGFLTLSVLIPFAVKILKNVEANSEWDYRRQCILYLVFLTRAYNYDDETLAKVETDLEAEGSSLEDLHYRFYTLYQQGFCTKAGEKPFINVHTFSHLEEQRKRTGPLWRFSAEDFESLYSVLRRCYRVGTTNPSKQVLENFYMRDMAFHRCRKGDGMVTAPANPNNSTIADNIVVNRQGFRAVIVEEDDHLICHPIDVYPLEPTFLGVKLPWHLVGVRRFGEINYNRRVRVKKAKLTGKGLLCGKVLTEWKKEWLGGSKKDH